MIITNQIQYIRNRYADAISNDLHNFFFPFEYQYDRIASHHIPCCVVSLTITVTGKTLKLNFLRNGIFYACLHKT